MTKCPFCAGYTQREAIRWWCCGEFLDGSGRPVTKVGVTALVPAVMAPPICQLAAPYRSLLDQIHLVGL